MKKEKISAIDQFAEIIGKNRFLKEYDNCRLFNEDDVFKPIPNIGPCFSLISDMSSIKFLRISEGSAQVLGYTSEEIRDRGADFIFQIVVADDLPQCLYLIKTAWEFIKALPLQSKLNHICNFYYRVARKDGSTIKVQLQVINLETDRNENILITCNTLTDISHLGLSDQVRLTIVNTEDNTCFTATAEEPRLMHEQTILSKRESEVLRLVAAGLNSREIADKLCISYYTVRTHRKNILGKLEKKNTAEMFTYILNNGLL